MASQLSTSDGTRVPPHNLEAEESVLGSMLLSKTAASEVLEVIQGSDDFYRPAHAEIYQAISDLCAGGEAADAVTVSEELRRRGRLEQVGGMPYIHTLVSSVPTAANAVYYARIVTELGILRRLIDVSTQIAAEAYEVPEDIAGAVNRAEDMIYGLAQGRARQDFKPIRELLQESMQHIEDLASRGDDITGLRTGFNDLDSLLAGMQPGNLILVAARPAMGKSTLAMNIGQHVALHEKLPVVMFSLEMSWMEIVQRMICSEARVDTKRIRGGKMGDAEWHKISRAVGLLAEAPMFIDDTSTITMGEIRGKCRRLKQKCGGKLGLVVVDYLQLMTSPRRIENRTQEVAEISRSMKILAKELDVPVLAVSQLSRQLEQAGAKPRKPRLADLRECVTGDTLVVLADGRRVPIADLVGTTPRVLATTADGKIAEADADAVWPVGLRQVFTVRLASGKEIRATADHRLLGAEGWRHIRDMQPGDRLATARVLPEPADPEPWPEDHLVLLAHLIGDGSYLTHQPLRYTTASEDNSAFVAIAAQRAFGVTVNRHEGRGNWHQLVLSGNGNRWHPRGVNRWLRELGVFNQRSHDKRVPSPIFRIPNEQIALFLRHLWATDGTIAVRRPGGRGSHGVAFSTCSLGLARDVTALLLRLGIHSRLQTVPQKSGRPVYYVAISSVSNQDLFLEVVGAVGPRRPQAEALTHALAGMVPNVNVDTLPKEVFGRVTTMMRTRGISQRAMASLRGTSYGGSSHFRFAPSRDLLGEYAELLDDDLLRAQATSDLFWDRVISVEPAGEEQVYDLTVPGPSCWLADGIVSHNSGALEQDADVVMFVYREEYYEPETDRKGEADIMVEKHRNGPTGTIALTFAGQYTRFENFARTGA